MLVTAGVIESPAHPYPRPPAPSYLSFSLLQDQGLQKSVLRKKVQVKAIYLAVQWFLVELSHVVYSYP